MTDLLVEAAIRASETLAVRSVASSSVPGDAETSEGPFLVRLVVVGIATFVAAFVPPFDMATVFHIIVHVAAMTGLVTIDARVPVSYIVCMALSTSWSTAVAHRRHVWWPLVGMLLVPCAVSACVGTALLARCSSTALETSLGVIMLGVGFWGVACSTGLINAQGETDTDKVVFSTDPSLTIKEAALGIVCAAQSGLLGGMFGLHGPPLAVASAAMTPISGHRMRATMMCLFAATAAVQVIFMSSKGLFDWTKQWPCYMTAFAAGIVAAKVRAVRPTHAAVSWPIAALSLFVGSSMAVTDGMSRLLHVH